VTTLRPRVFGGSPDTPLDAPDFYHTTIFSNSTFDGLGSWGDPENDNQITTGGFKNITVAYPVPHKIRRNYQPYLGGTQLLINTSFTKENVDFTVNSFTGDFVGFHAYTESILGPHPGPHIILGGDMSGLCPFGMAPPQCYPGQRWSPNGECASSRLFARAQRYTQTPCFSSTTRYVLSAVLLRGKLTCWIDDR